MKAKEISQTKKLNKPYLHKKSNSLENKEFQKLFKMNFGLTDGFKKIINEGASTVNTMGQVGGNTLTNTFITIQNNENEEEEKKNKLTYTKKTNSSEISKSKAAEDKSCLINGFEEENFHHFPNIPSKLFNIRKASGEKLLFGKKKKRINFRTKSLQIIKDEGIIESSILKNF